MAATPSIEVDIHANVGIVRPGDKLVIGVSQPLSAHGADQLKSRIQTQLPGADVVIIEAHTLAVYRR